MERRELAEDAKRFLLLQYTVLHPLLIVTVVNAFTFLAAVAIPKYVAAANVLAILMLALFFVPQTTMIRNFWMVDRKLGRVGVSNLVGLAATAAAIGAAVAISALELEPVAWGTVIGYGVYFVFILATIGRELWGGRAASAIGAHALVGVVATAVLTLGLGVADHQESAGEAAATLVWHLAIAYLVLAPLVVYGVKKTRLLEQLQSVAARQEAVDAP